MRRALLLVSVAALFSQRPVRLSAFAQTSGKAAASATPGVTRRPSRSAGRSRSAGIAAIYAPIPKGMDAYFKYVNSRKGPDGKKGVYGRKIVWKYYDDGYNPSQTVQFTHKLVEQDKVFAIVGSLGTEHNLAIRPYLNDGKIPRPESPPATAPSGCDTKKVPVDDRLAARLHLGRPRSTRAGFSRTPRTRRSRSSTRTTATGRITSQGLEDGLGAKKSLIVSKENYEENDTTLRFADRAPEALGCGHLGALHDTGADREGDAPREGAQLEAGHDHHQLRVRERRRHARGRGQGRQGVHERRHQRLVPQKSTPTRGMRRTR